MWMYLLRLAYRSKLEAIVCLSVLSVTTLVIQMYHVLEGSVLSDVQTQVYTKDYRHMLQAVLNQSSLTDLSHVNIHRAVLGDNREIDHVLGLGDNREIDHVLGLGDNREIDHVVSHGQEQPTEYCPIKYNMSSCSFEMYSMPSEKIVHEPSGRVIRYIYKYRQGAMSINGQRVHKWRTTANLILLHVNSSCHVLNISMSPTSPPSPKTNTTKRPRPSEVLINNVQNQDLVLGILYGDIISYNQELYQIGITKGLLRHIVPRRGILVFLSRKGFPGHMKYVINSKGGNVTVLKTHFYFGHNFDYKTEALGYGSVLKYHAELTPGGHWWPQSCLPRWRIAIIVPFRQREQHLWTFIDNMVRFLQLQNIEFTMIVVEQAGDVLFNRAALMNIGYLEAKKLGSFDCFAFHDVDQVPEDLSNLYSCSDMPRHLMVTRSVSNYRFIYNSFFGGAIMMTADQIDKINGFPNRIYGWGGEDDEISARVSHVGMQILRYPREIGRYYSLTHGNDKANPHINRSPREIWQYVGQYIQKDGLNTLVYDLVSIEKRALYTHVVVYIPGPHDRSEVRPIVNRTTTRHPVPEDELELDDDYNENSDPKGDNLEKPILPGQMVQVQPTKPSNKTVHPIQQKVLPSSAKPSNKTVQPVQQKVLPTGAKPSNKTVQPVQQKVWPTDAKSSTKTDLSAQKVVPPGVKTSNKTTLPAQKVVTPGVKPSNMAPPGDQSRPESLKEPQKDQVQNPSLQQLVLKEMFKQAFPGQKAPDQLQNPEALDQLVKQIEQQMKQQQEPQQHKSEQKLQTNQQEQSQPGQQSQLQSELRQEPKQQPSDQETQPNPQQQEQQQQQSIQLQPQPKHQQKHQQKQQQEQQQEQQQQQQHQQISETTPNKHLESLSSKPPGSKAGNIPVRNSQSSQDLNITYPRNQQDLYQSEHIQRNSSYHDTHKLITQLNNTRR